MRAFTRVWERRSLNSWTRDLVVVGVVWVPAAFLSLAGSEQAFPEGLAEVGAASDQDEV